MNAIDQPIKTISQKHLNDVMQAAARVAGQDDGLLLSILSRALICAAKTAGVPRLVLQREIDRSWDETAGLIPRIGSRR